MPEGIEVEIYRRAAAATTGRVVAVVDVRDGQYPRGGLGPADVAAVAEGRRIVGVRRVGKVLLVDLGDAATVGASEEAALTIALRFGMTGRLLVDGTAAIERLAYASDRNDPAWDRVVVTFEDGTTMRVRDQRRLGSIEVDPDETRLGPDAAGIDATTLGALLAGSTRPLKAKLLDQEAIAGLGNLLTDEILWRAGLDPSQGCTTLDPAEVESLAATIRSTFADLTYRGGSHTGDLQLERHRDGRCPRDGERLERRTVGGRTTYACPVHQGGPESKR